MNITRYYIDKNTEGLWGELNWDARWWQLHLYETRENESSASFSYPDEWSNIEHWYRRQRIFANIGPLNGVVYYLVSGIPDSGVPKLKSLNWCATNKVALAFYTFDVFFPHILSFQLYFSLTFLLTNVPS